MVRGVPVGRCSRVNIQWLWLVFDRLGVRVGRWRLHGEKGKAMSDTPRTDAVTKRYLWPASAAKSCDECRYQEGRHYCLLHTVTLKNMDTIRCHDFVYKPNPAGEPTAKDVGSSDLLAPLKRLVGGWALRALRRGCPLRVWRRSSPHNWFIENERGNMLWHSECEHPRELPDLRLFRKVSDSKQRICLYWGADSGMPELTLYRLR